MSMKIYTRTGDEGETGLFGGGRVPKDHPRVAAYGDVDELNSAIGVARATAPAQFFDPLLESVQRDLFAIGGHLATPDPGQGGQGAGEGGAVGGAGHRVRAGHGRGRRRSCRRSARSCCRPGRPRPPRCTSPAPSAAARSGAW